MKKRLLLLKIRKILELRSFIFKPKKDRIRNLLKMANQGNDIRFETEIKIFNAAYNQFLLFGYHGTRIRYIAKEAKVLPAAVHYYFRSKEKLYVKIIYQVINDISDIEQEGIGNRGDYARQKWFLRTELYNNQELLFKSLQELYLNKWESKLSKIRTYLGTKT